MTQEDATSGFEMFASKASKNATEADSSGNATEERILRPVPGVQMVDLFVKSHGCEEHRTHLNMIAKPIYNVDPDEWAKLRGA